MNSKYEFIKDELIKLEEESLIRNLNIFTTSQDVKSIINNKKMLLFSSSNYLSLSKDQNILKNAYKVAKKYGLGSGGSRLTTGNSKYHEKLEDKIAEFISYESVILFSSGYNTNIGVISSLCNNKTIIFSDELNHASIIDGCRLAGSQIVIYKHQDFNDLEEKLKLYNNKRKVVISDGVFSMDGDILNLERFVEISNKYSAISIVDDAHGLGVIGSNGRGVVEYYNNKYYPDILIGTLSKAIASEGGFCATSKTIKRFLQNKARSYIFSTSLSPFVVGSSYYAIDYLMNSNDNVKILQDNIRYFVNGLNNIGIYSNSQTSIIKIVIGNEKKAMQVSKELQEQNIYIPAIRFPSVKKDQAILRITLMKEHTKKDLDFVLDNLKKLKIKYKF